MADKLIADIEAFLKMHNILPDVQVLITHHKQTLTDDSKTKVQKPLIDHWSKYGLIHSIKGYLLSMSYMNQTRLTKYVQILIENYEKTINLIETPAAKIKCNKHGECHSDHWSDIKITPNPCSLDSCCDFLLKKLDVAINRMGLTEGKIFVSMMGGMGSYHIFKRDNASDKVYGYYFEYDDVYENYATVNKFLDGYRKI